MRYLSAMLTVSSIHLFQINTPESIEDNKKLWRYLRQSDPVLCRKLRFTLAGLVNRKTALGRWAAKCGYGIAANLFKFA